MNGTGRDEVVDGQDGVVGEDTGGPRNPARRRVLGGFAAAGVGLVLGGRDALSAPRPDADARLDATLRSRVRHIVVIYAENRSFSNLYGNFPGVRHPLAEAPALVTVQLDRDGRTPLPQLPKIWGGLVPRPQTVDGRQFAISQDQIAGLRNGPFHLTDASGAPLPLGVITRDLWHRFYQNQMQINAGRNNQFAAWANSGGLVMGHYRDSARSLKLWNLATQYTLCDNFFMSAFGGSWLNHMFLISAQAPHYADAQNSPVRKLLSVLEGDDPTGTRLKVAARSPALALDGPPVFEKDRSLTPDGYAVNTMAAAFQPSHVRPAPGGDPAYADPSNVHVLPPQHYATIGDRLSDKGVAWAWYSGAWQYALDHDGTGPIPDFQYHHQPFNYFANYAPGTEARALHLRDGGMGNDPATNRFIAEIDAGRLPEVAFYKPQSSLNMHAGYADVASGDRHVATIVEHIRRGPQWKDTVIIITHDENGGWWDHVSPPKGDRWGPGNRIPALVISPFARKGHVDHTLYDTCSIQRFINRVHGLEPLDGVAARDKAFAAGGRVPPGDLTAALDLA